MSLYNLFIIKSLFTIAVYWCNCILYAVACFTEECYEYGWYKYNLSIMKKKGYLDEPERMVFARSLLYAVSIILAIKQCTMIEWVIHDQIIMFALLSVAYYLYGFCFSSLCATMVLNNQHKLNYKDYMKTISLYFIKNKVHPELCTRAAKHLLFRWELNENTEVFGV